MGGRCFPLCKVPQSAQHSSSAAGGGGGGRVPTHDANVGAQRDLEVEFRWDVVNAPVVGDGELEARWVSDGEAGASVVSCVRHHVADGHRGNHCRTASIRGDDGRHAELSGLAGGGVEKIEHRFRVACTWA